MIMIATGDLEIRCVFCGNPCSADGRLECTHLETVTLVPEYALSDRCKYIFHFRSNRGRQAGNDFTA